MTPIRLRCPICGYEYTEMMPGWAFKTTKSTKCIGRDVLQDGRVATMHSYNHPFEIVRDGGRDGKA